MKLSQAQKALEFLKSNPNQKFTARFIAGKLITNYPQDYIEKRKNIKFENNEGAFKQQIIRELYRIFPDLIQNNPCIKYQEKPSPRQYWYEPSSNLSTPTKFDSQNSLNIDIEDNTSFSNQEKIFSEHDLYPVLIEYLSKELQLFSLRIDEKKSSNNRGQNGNQWLHPDLVAMQPLDKKWHELIKTCVKHGSGQNVRLWSFEVKKELNSSNIRSSFFQAVSNSSWANEGYLVATSISTAEVEEELRMLSALHGIGVILLIPDNPTESEILLPARRKPEVDWQSINRILNENADFKNFIELVSIYYQTGRIRLQDWNH
ncbi:COG2958 family protein [Acinetobacter sp. ULE_I057]|uniref:COG2958 family protein n=1 Tax=Acinetobacter sp. ULE_I057 TaxID=3373070 RepID=UPI003AF55754